MNEERKISIIIPLSSDVESAIKCLIFCDKFIGEKHQIIIIDDAVTNIISESEIINFIKTKQKRDVLLRQNDSCLASQRLGLFEYHKNKQRLGYVRTCNKAVFEFAKKDNDILLLSPETEITDGLLDEMVECLYDFEKHSIVCPRINKTSFLPYRYITASPTNFSCILIKRKTVDNFGLFDETFGSKNCAVNDFLCRINRYGYSSVISNRSFVFTNEAIEITDEKDIDLLNRRYPEYNATLSDHYAKFPKVNNSTKRILIDLTYLHPIHSGTTEHSLSLAEELYPLLKTKYECSIATNSAANVYFGMSKTYKDLIICNNYNLNDQFDLIYTPYQLFDPNNLFMINRAGAKFIIGMLDIITLRCNYLQRPILRFLFESVIKYADGLITNSDNVLHDIKSFLPYIEPSALQLRKTIYITKYTKRPRSKLTSSEKNILNKLPNNYFFIIGNRHEHKALEITKKNLHDRFPTVILGYTETGPIDTRGQHWGLVSGQFSDEFVNALYYGCSAIIFPSQYEGFGLPILSAVQFQKPIILFDSETNREVTRRFNIDNLVYFFSNFKEINNLALNINSEIKYPPINRTWHDVAMETMEFIEKILDQPVNFSALNERFSALKSMEYLFENNKPLP